MKPVDPKCLELADHFLQHMPESGALTGDEGRHLLAFRIQETIENWLYHPYEPSQPTAEEKRG